MEYSGFNIQISAGKKRYPLAIVTPCSNLWQVLASTVFW
jgi:hypothetical protein